MEIFVDGGLFELIIAFAFGYLLNVIYLKKYLLLFYSSVSIIAPVSLLFLKRNDAFYLMVSLSIVNAIFLVVLLWQRKEQQPGEPLFDLQKWRRQLRFKKQTNASLKS